VTKCDIADKEQIQEVLDSDGSWMIRQRDRESRGKLKLLSDAIGSVVDDYMIVSFVMLDITDEDSLDDILNRTDHAIQYAEEQEVKDQEEFGDFGEFERE
jgi:hypothetical protein